MTIASPWLSVIVATYKRAELLRRCLGSVLAEPDPDIELLIGDDASPDHTPEVVAACATDPRVRYYRNATNLGMQGNYLKIMREARGQYVFILTDDDVLRPGALARVAAVVRDYPQVGLALSHLPTVDHRTGQVVDWHRTFPDSRLIPPAPETTVQLARSAWVLSRQVLRREWIDFATWERHRNNIFFPIIFAGRMALRAPAYYLAEALVEHTGFNEVFWEKFGEDELRIELNLLADHARCLRAIWEDQALTPAMERLLADWELTDFTTYLYRLPHGYDGLRRLLGPAAALQKLWAAFPETPARRRALAQHAWRMPLVRAWFTLRQSLKRAVPALAEAFRRWRTRGAHR